MESTSAAIAVLIVLTALARVVFVVVSETFVEPPLKLITKAWVAAGVA
ncbi:MAG: hypothetical protein AVDCRST_MAG90-3090 [uncultured Microvirga sp.]|uniref:Uncharacterized protein n=1 Tax=uncultured Microvirga sp. TaxID=412392 RepID=A0A6J4MKG4_9HYPH|nr:MAG: hypothetical protein AVDCRST_MAG90-3090 [uncultured Microvirga sp.]